ncbi:MAG: 2-oxoglutarate dehydrogenase E1 component [Candidatus Eutrophobiaceae bacterium]
MATDRSNPLYSGNAWFIEQLYERYLHSRESVAAPWREYFDSIQESEQPRDIPHSPIRQALLGGRRMRSGNGASGNAVADVAIHQKQSAVSALIEAYRFHGHSQADIDPLRQHERPGMSNLDIETHGLEEADLGHPFSLKIADSAEELPLSQIIELMRSTYCKTIGVEYLYINDIEQTLWLQERLERTRGKFSYDAKRKRHILKRIIAANALEEYLHTRYVGQKRFSLEGGESLIPLLDCIIQDAGSHSIKEMVIGMAHRGRINVLVNSVGKKPSELFDEFEGKATDVVSGSGDVKYHMGYSSDIHTRGGSLHLALAFNPSHLEIIGPVVEGSTRARQDRRMDTSRNEILPVIIHGDAAFAGQGVVMETFNLSQTHGYSTGGTVHIIINNQIGFTTSEPLDSRSTLHCTDVAKMIQAPIFHVNADDPEAVVYVAALALEFRIKFKKDVVIDMVCYRKHGHSEADEPFTTQPMMYQKIRKHLGTRELYTRKLLDEGLVTVDELQEFQRDYIESLEDNRSVAGTHADVVDPKYQIDFSRFQGVEWTAFANTCLDLDTIRTLAKKIVDVPENFKVHPAVERILHSRQEMGEGRVPCDWGWAETLAYASLLVEGYSVRVSGQDCGRGTFFHRHAVIHDQNSGETWLPLRNMSPDQAPFLVINSTLSEEAVLAFEYGYSSSSPDTLVVWEAQFGDFANGAQVVFDQFISSCESKWGRYCGLVVFLPHGYDGQGPEHSSARLERFLQLCAEKNMQVCCPSTAAQMFHMLRRQMVRAYRKPLIVMTPKSLLRRKLSASDLSLFVNGGFQNVIDEIDALDKSAVKRLTVCSGKIYYDILEERRKRGISDIAIVRIEQLYPFPREEMRTLISQYPNLSEVVWVQEEPKNQGAWYYMHSRGTMLGCLGSQHEFGYAGRFYSASPATGHMALHNMQQAKVVDDALSLDKLEVSRFR